MPSVLIVYTRCHEPVFPTWKTNLPCFQLTCHPETNKIDCREAVPMLEFLIQIWDSSVARKYIFIHAHETAHHYRRSVFDQIHQLIRSDYFRENRYGAVFPEYGRGHGRDMTESMYGYIYHNTSMPPRMIDKDNFRPSCSTFFVDSDLVRTRTVDEYQLIISRLRQWSRENPRRKLGDAAYYCSRILEYTWHILLANLTNIPPLPADLDFVHNSSQSEVTSSGNRESIRQRQLRSMWKKDIWTNIGRQGMPNRGYERWSSRDKSDHHTERGLNGTL
jgi:hypothetical protein